MRGLFCLFSRGNGSGRCSFLSRNCARDGLAWLRPEASGGEYANPEASIHWWARGRCAICSRHRQRSASDLELATKPEFSSDARQKFGAKHPVKWRTLSATRIFVHESHPGSSGLDHPEEQSCRAHILARDVVQSRPRSGLRTLQPETFMQKDCINYHSR